MQQDSTGATPHIAWTRHLLDNRECIVRGGTQPNTEPSRGEGLDGSATAEEGGNYHPGARMRTLGITPPGRPQHADEGV